MRRQCESGEQHLVARVRFVTQAYLEAAGNLVATGKTRKKRKSAVWLSRAASGNDVSSKATVILQNGGLARGLATRLPLVTERCQRKNGVNLGATTEGAKA